MQPFRSILAFLVVVLLAGTAWGTSGAFDIVTGKLIVRFDPPATVFNMLASGRHGGAWDGPGINSSVAAAEYVARGYEYTAVGMVVNADLMALGYTPYTSFGGITPLSDNWVLSAYTYAGDANLDGRIDSWDYGLFNLGLQIQQGTRTGSINWLTGDFNYDHVVDAADRTILDRVFAAQGDPINPEVTPVPEPATLVLLLTALAGTACCALRPRRATGV